MWQGLTATNGEASLCDRNRAEIIVFMWRTESLPTLRAVVSRSVRPGETTARRVIPTRCGVNTESVAKPSCCCCCFLSNYVVGVLFVYFDYMLEFQPVLSRISNGLCHAFSYLQLSSLQLIFKNNGPVLLLKTIFRHWTDSCYGSLAVSGQDIWTLIKTLRWIGPTSSIVIAVPAEKSPKKLSGLVRSGEISVSLISSSLLYWSILCMGNRH